MSPLRFRQVHLDFHTSPAIPEIGVDFDPDEFVATLKAAGRQHTFVTEEGGRRICGLFSATHIARRLGVDVSTHEVATSFAQIEAALAR